MDPASSKNHFHYNHKLKKWAYENRYTMVKSEAVMWKHVLSKRQVLGFTFNRQRPVLNYIADFMCKSLLLIIEVDGISHHCTEVADNDAVRQEKLEAVGFQVLRFDALEVLRNIKQVNQVTRTACQQRAIQLGIPIPSSS